MLKDLFKRMDDYLFVGEDGVRSPKYVTGDRFNGGVGIKLSKIKRKVRENETVIDEDTSPVEDSIIYAEDTGNKLRLKEPITNGKPAEPLNKPVDTELKGKRLIQWEGYLDL